MVLINANLTKPNPNVLIIILEYIDLLQSEWQHETNIWEGRLPCTLPFYIAAFNV